MIEAPLIAKVQKGQEFIITKRGVPIAKLSPLNKEIPSKTPEQVVDDILQFRKKHTLGKNISIEMLKSEGRK